MRLGIFGAIALVLGIWALVYCHWFAVEVIKGLLTLGLLVGGLLIIAVAIKRMCRERPSSEKEE